MMITKLYYEHKSYIVMGVIFGAQKSTPLPLPPRHIPPTTKTELK